jgi:hypothetical protein
MRRVSGTHRIGSPGPFEIRLGGLPTGSRDSHLRSGPIIGSLRFQRRIPSRRWRGKVFDASARPFDPANRIRVPFVGRPVPKWEMGTDLLTRFSVGRPMTGVSANSFMQRWPKRHCTASGNRGAVKVESNDVGSSIGPARDWSVPPNKRRGG